MAEYEPLRAKQVLDVVWKYGLLALFQRWSEAYPPILAAETTLQRRRVREPAILRGGRVQSNLNFNARFPVVTIP